MSEASKTPETREQQEARLDAMLVDKLVGPLHRQLAEALDRAQELTEAYRAHMIRLEQQSSRIAELEDKLTKILSWCEAYPLDIFPEPDFAKARALLEAGGMTLDAVSASNMRHVLKGVEALASSGQGEGK